MLRRLAPENDERIWTVAEVASALGVPAITGTLHHHPNPGALGLREALDLSLPTWANRGARPKVYPRARTPKSRPARTPTPWISGPSMAGTRT